MKTLRLIRSFARASIQQEMTYSTNFLLAVLNTLLSLGTSIAAIAVVFQQIETLRGWNFSSTLALLSIYIILEALRSLCFSPSLNALAGLEGAIWTGTFDFTLLRPVHPQLIASFQQWRPLALIDLLLGIVLLLFAISQMEQSITPISLFSFVLSLIAAVTILYSLLLGLASLVCWGPGLLYTWILDSLIQLARYPLQLYPGWLRLVLTWVIPIGLMTTVPATALSGTLSINVIMGIMFMALLLFTGASLLFQAGLQRYNSASS